ncbi:hypothetical protein BGP75_07060 [Motiliproteus sp. MSK22-1]|nr:hypothetical protein BGP75_07060 [Motiliproteus sp. MSK22-1]
MRWGGYWCAVFLGLALLTGCGQPAARQPSASISSFKTTSSMSEPLYAQYLEWRGTPYRLGGNSRQGVDCSSFVQQTFSQRLGISLPRTTAEQHRIGKSVARNQLQTGDLIFFKTEVKVRHVGIYLGDQVFLHASTSQGVTLSRLDNVYWSPRYWKAKRVITSS